MWQSQIAPGTVFAKAYRVVRPLKEGGMGAVYVAEQIATGAQRALKLMQPQLVRDPVMRRKFEQEARVSARIPSDHVVQVVDAGVDDERGVPWLAMELLEGQDLDSLLEQRGALDLSEAREVCRQLCHALSAAHAAGVVHRDLKPENIFVAQARQDGVPFMVKVLDFGIAKVVAESTTLGTAAMGTPLWMAPEQTCAGQVVGPATDIWPLGLLMFRVLTGLNYWRVANQRPQSVVGIMREVTVDPIARASDRAREFGRADRLPPGFDEWFARCVTRELHLRYADAAQACQGFLSCTARGASRPVGGWDAPGTGPRPEPVPAPWGVGPSGTTAPPPPVIRPVWVVGGLAAVALLVAGAVTLSRRPDTPAPTPTPPLVAQSRPAVSPAVSPAVATCSADAAQGPLSQRTTACESGCNAGRSAECLTAAALLKDAKDEDGGRRAEAVLRRACDAKEDPACVELAQLYATGRPGVARDLKKALAVQVGRCDARRGAGCGAAAAWLYGGTDGIDKDVKRACGLYKQGCEAGDSEACDRQVKIAAECRKGRHPTSAPPRCDRAHGEVCAEQCLKGRMSSCEVVLTGLVKTCDSGSVVESCRWAGLVYMNHAKSSDEPKEDLKHALALFLRGCRHGDDVSCSAANETETLLRRLP